MANQIHLVSYLLWLVSHQTLPTLEQSSTSPPSLPSPDPPTDCRCDPGSLNSEQQQHQQQLALGAESPFFMPQGVLQVPGDYNKNLEPPGNPARVDIGFIVNDILEVNDEEYTLTLKVLQEISCSIQ